MYGNLPKVHLGGSKYNKSEILGSECQMQ